MKGTIATCAAVLVVSVALLLATNLKKKANDAALFSQETETLKNLGRAFIEYTTDHGGLTPTNPSSSPLTWADAAHPDAEDAWFNVLPKQMGFRSPAELGPSRGNEFYDDMYPLCVAGAPYVKDLGKRATRPSFAIGMNDRLPRGRTLDGKAQQTLASILQPVNTVLFLTRGLPEEETANPFQTGFDGAPAAGPSQFVERHNGLGILLFVDGHVEARRSEELVGKHGAISHPSIIWDP